MTFNLQVYTILKAGFSNTIAMSNKLYMYQNKYCQHSLHERLEMI